MRQRTLRDVLVVDLHIAGKRFVQVLAAVKAGGGEHLRDAAVEALDHAVGLGMAGFDQAMLNGIGGTDLIEDVRPSGLALAGGAETVGELLAVVSEHLGKPEGSGLDQALQEAAGADSGLVREDFDVHPTAGPVNGGEQVVARALTEHLRQILHVHMHETRGVVPEGLRRRTGAFLARDQIL